MVCGMVKNSSDRGESTSILFKAFRMELNLTILYYKTVILALDHRPGNHSKASQNLESHPSLESLFLLSRGIANEPLDL
jgi:hypothetical protein